MFELVGPPCEDEACAGTLINTITVKTGECFRKCIVCGQKFNKMTVEEKVSWATRSFDRILRGEKED